MEILLYLKSEFNEVYFSERRNFEASHKIPTSKNKFGWRNLQGFGTVKFLLVSSDQREDLIFSATMPKAKNQSKISISYQFLP